MVLVPLMHGAGLPALKATNISHTTPRFVSTHPWHVLSPARRLCRLVNQLTEAQRRAPVNVSAGELKL